MSALSMRDLWRPITEVEQIENGRYSSNYRAFQLWRFSQ